MIIIENYKSEYPYTDELSCAFGYFDGLHLGHMKVIEKTKQPNFKRAVVTFSNRPLNFVMHEAKAEMLMSREEKIAFFEKIGIDYLFIFDFNDEIMNTSKEDFVKKFMVKYHIKHVSVGFNYTFGKNKEGTSDNIKELCAPYGISVDIVNEEESLGECISTSLIKEALSQGNIIRANQMLGRCYSVSGKVNYGKQLGRRIGFPTANLLCEESRVLPKWGVYAAKCTIMGKTYYAVTNVGNNPTVEDGSKVSVESYILDFHEEIYGEEITVEFLFRIRDEHKFDSIEELTKQINRDAETVRNLR